MNFRQYQFTKAFSIKGVPIFMHWSLVSILVICAACTLKEPSFGVGAASFFAILLIHELGHMWFANMYGRGALNIKLYPMHGYCSYTKPDTAYEEYVIAWGGVIAQAAVFVPAILLLVLFGDSFPWYISTPLIFFGPISAFIAAFNLVPSPSLDGYKCWKAIPLFLKYSHKRKPKSSVKKNHLKRVK